MALKSWWAKLWDRNGMSPLTESVPQSVVYLDDRDIFICSHVFCTDRRDGPSEPIARFPLAVTASQAGAAILGALLNVRAPLPPDSYERTVQQAFAQMGIDTWDALEKRFWHIIIWQEEEGLIRFQTTRRAAGGGYVSFVSDYSERARRDEHELGAAALRALETLNRTPYADAPSHT